MIGMILSDTLTSITMPSSDVIGQVAEEAKLDPRDVERVLELVAENLETAAERHESVVVAAGAGRPQLILALMTALVRAEEEGVLDEATLGTLRALRNLAVHAGTVGRVLEALLPDQIVVPTPAAVLQARRNAEARNALLEEFGALRSHEVADLAGSHASNRAATANRWRTEGRVLAVPLRAETLYPGFQFTPDGQPHPAIQPALKWLRSDPYTTDWQAALWFATPTSWLGGRRPVDVLGDDPDAVVEAARQEVSDRAG
jgi:hypothetical protein